MASRTKQKEEARARRLAEETARAERARRERRLRLVGGVVLAAVAVVVAAIAISSGGGSKTAGLQTGTKANQTLSSVNQLLTGIPQSGAVLGSPSAKVTLTYYGDLECPVCRDFTLNGGWPQLVANEVRAGKVKVVFRAFETASTNPQTFQTQQVAALAAGKQNLFWNYVELFYNEQGAEGSGYVTDSYLAGLARQIPALNQTQWQAARSDQTLLSQVQADGAAAQAAGVQGTPTLIFQGPKGKASPSTTVASYSDLQNALKQVS
jgi:protein-disulfide isomerase